jgi:formylglycine-generating enzyme required for sulfatase activity
VVHVTWDEAADFCVRLSDREEERAAGRSYRLPTEAEWEYACRAGTMSQYAFGDKLSPALANTEDGGPGETTEVGSYPANLFGLFDMHGNVWEWCAGWYGGQPRGRDPQGPATGNARVMRGGAFWNPASVAGSGRRNFTQSERGHPNVGFRVAMTRNVARRSAADS